MIIVIYEYVSNDNNKKTRSTFNFNKQQFLFPMLVGFCFYFIIIIVALHNLLKKSTRNLYENNLYWRSPIIHYYSVLYFTCSKEIYSTICFSTVGSFYKTAVHLFFMTSFYEKQFMNYYSIFSYFMFGYICIRARILTCM